MEGKGSLIIHFWSQTSEKNRLILGSTSVLPFNLYLCPYNFIYVFIAVL